jgi:hypothetical protein
VAFTFSRNEFLKVARPSDERRVMNCLSRMSGLHRCLPGEAAVSHCRSASVSHDICLKHCQVDCIVCVSALWSVIQKPSSHSRSALLSGTAFRCAQSNHLLTLLSGNHSGHTNAVIARNPALARHGLSAAAVNHSSMSSQPTVRDSERKLYHEKGNAD